MPCKIRIKFTHKKYKWKKYNPEISTNFKFIEEIFLILGYNHIFGSLWNLIFLREV